MMNDDSRKQIEQYEKLAKVRREGVAERLEMAKLYRESGDFGKAEAALKEAIALDPDNGQAYCELGTVYQSKDDIGSARQAYEQALSLNPSDSIATIELGKICYRQKDVARARGLWESAARIDPSDPRPYLHLAKLFRLEGDYEASEKNFACARRCDPENRALREFSAAKDGVKGQRGEVLPYRVFFTWGMHYQCNYQCSYCYIPRPAHADFRNDGKYEAVYPGTAAVIGAWERIAEKYGKCRIRLDGGEPSCYPDFIPLVRRLSRLHRLQINTNLSFDVARFVSELSPGDVRVDASFHAEHASLEEFLKKAVLLHEEGFRVVVSFVAHPPAFDRIPRYREAFEAAGITFILHPFSGHYEGRRYPDSYSAEQVKILYGIDRESKTELEWRKEGNEAEGAAPGSGGGERGCACETGAVCRMGQMYARIYPNGDVFRCCTDDGLLHLGNLFAHTVALLDEAAPCAQREKCRCWRCMIIGEEERWSHTWLDDWEMPF